MKSLTLVLSVIAILGAAASGFFYVQIGNTKADLQAKLNQSQQQTTTTQAKLTDANSQIDTLQKRLTSMDDDLGSTKTKLTEADNHNVELARQVEQANNQVAARDDAVKSLNNQIGDLKNQIAAAQLAANQAVQTQADTDKKTIDDLKSQLAQLQPATPIVGVSAAGSVATPANLSGQVVSIGMKNAFVVLNIGAPQGVKVGQKFSIANSAGVLATAQVSSIEGDYSIAQVDASSLIAGLAKGDTATLAK